jgi:hypothetical protein
MNLSTGNNESGMTLHHSVRYPALCDPGRGIQCLALFLVSALCTVLATGCFSQPQPIGIGLKPVAPLPLDKEAEVDQSPTFRWEQFPRQQDRQELDPRGNRIAAVSYEFRLWKVGAALISLGIQGTKKRGRFAEGDYKYSWEHACRDTDPGEVVLSKKGLLTPQYHVEIPLEPDSYYFWSVRAHFTLDGKRRATEWSEQLIDVVLRDGKPDRGLGLIDSNGCSYKATFHLIYTRPPNPVNK